MPQSISIAPVNVGKESWQVQFEEEPVNDDRWTCSVTAAVETKIEDEECIRLFSNYIESNKIEFIQIITLPDVIKLFDNLKNTRDKEGKSVQNEEKRNKEKQREEAKDSTAFPPQRYPEIFSLVSKHFSSLDGNSPLPPELMAYAIKYVIIMLKDRYSYRRRIHITEARKKREADIKSQIMQKSNPNFVRPEEKERGLEMEEKEKKESFSKNGEAKSKTLEKEGTGFPLRTDSFDLFTVDEHKPYNGPDMYILLSGFYNPLYFVQLQRMNVPFTALIKIENFKPFANTGRATSSLSVRRHESLGNFNNFWNELGCQMINEERNVLYKDIAMIKYCTPDFVDGESAAVRIEIISDEMSKLLFTAYHIDRLHGRYISQMKVFDIDPKFEPLNLSECEVYNTLCNIMISNDFKAEIFVLFAMVEQVVSGIPETMIGTPTEPCQSIHSNKCVKEIPTEAITPSSEGFQMVLCGGSSDVVENDALGQEEEEEQGRDFHFTPSYLSKILKSKKENSMAESAGYSLSPDIYLYDDDVSLATHNIDRRVIRPDVICKRFLINLALSEISKKFPKFTLAEKCEFEYQFFRFWERSKESEDSLKIKLFFTIAMKLMESNKSIRSEFTEETSSTTTSVEKGTVMRSEEKSSGCDFICDSALHLFYMPGRGTEVKYETVYKKSSSVHLKKAQAYSIFQKVMSEAEENLEAACGAKCSDVFQDPELELERRERLSQLRIFLDAPQFSFLNVPSFLIDQVMHQEFVAKYNFYEILEPNRAIQRLQNIRGKYTALEYKYFSPTDTLFVLGQNAVENGGLSRFGFHGHIPVPLCLRDFFKYVIPENQKWLEEENAKYLQFLRGIYDQNVAEARKKDHNYKCSLLQELQSIPESQQRKFTGLPSVCVQKRSQDKIGRRKKTKESAKEESKDSDMDSLFAEDLDELPIKADFPRKEEFSFFGINFKEIRTEVNEIRKEFYSKDGTVVSVRVESWTCMENLVTLIIQKLYSTLYFHTWLENGIFMKSFHFTDRSQLLYSFQEHQDENGPLHGLFCKVVWPVGLTVEPLPFGKNNLYIKQSYSELYSAGKGMQNEIYRCNLPNGQVLIFYPEGMVNVLSPSGTKYGCRSVAKKPCRQSAADPRFETEIYEVLTPMGELWSKEGCSKCMRLLQTMKVLVGVDRVTKEVYQKRDDGTDFMLWPDGKLVITYPDGTKITSTPNFDEEEVFLWLESEMEERDDLSDQYIDQSLLPGELYRPNPASNYSLTSEKSASEGFVSVSCSYLQEHPKYATSYWNNEHLDLRMPGNASAKMTAKGLYAISSENSELSVSDHTIQFYNKCLDCEEKSNSVIYLDPNQYESGILSVTEDLFGHRFSVYYSGCIVHNKESKTNQLDEGFVQPEESLPYWGHCQHAKMSPHPRRCLIIQRDLTGVEFIDDDSLSRYVDNLSRDAYFDLSKLSGCNGDLQHSFLDPVDNMTEENYQMPYECDDAYPTTLKKKDLVPLAEFKSGMAHSRRTFHVKGGLYVHKPEAVPRPPKMWIVRFINVLRPDPITVMKKIKDLVVLYQKRASDSVELYQKLSHEKLTAPFARHVANQVDLIASCLCQSIDIYPHTCTIIPYTECDIHSIAHQLHSDEYFSEGIPSNINTNTLPDCNQIAKYLRHKTINRAIPEVSSKSETENRG